MIRYDRLLGFNQSYRLIKALIDYNKNNNLSEEVKKSYNAELESFLNEIKTKIDSKIDINVEKDLNDISVYGNNVLNNIFSSETKISKEAANFKIFNSITKYIVNNNINNHTKIKEIFIDVKNALDKDLDLSSYKDKYEFSIDEINKELKNTKEKYKANSETRDTINTIYKEILEGLDLMTSNEPNLSNYFKTDLYFSLAHHVSITNTIIKNLTDKSKYKLLSKTIENLTKDENNNNEVSLFKDGI